MFVQIRLTSATDSGAVHATVACTRTGLESR